MSLQVHQELEHVKQEVVQAALHLLLQERREMFLTGEILQRKVKEPRIQKHEKEVGTQGRRARLGADQALLRL